jgi:lipopolysaccharide biosynthesis regulator YciM
MDKQEKFFTQFRENPKDQKLFVHLEESFFLEKKWSSLAELYQLRADFLEKENRVEAVKILAKLGDLYVKRLGDKTLAIAVYENAMRLHPQSRLSFDLLPLYFEIQEWQKAVALLEQELEFTKEESTKNLIRTQLGVLYHRYLSRKERAKEFYQAVLETERTHTQAFRGLQEIYSEDQEWSDLKKLWELQLANASGDSERFLGYQQLAQLAEDRLHDSELALQYYEEALELSPQHEETLQHLEQIYESRGNLLKQLEMMTRRAKEMPYSPVRTELYQQIALFAEELGKSDQAILALRHIIVEEPQALDVLENLLRLYESRGDRRAFAEILEKKFQAVEDFKVKQELALTLARLFEEEFFEEEGAMYYYRWLLEQQSSPSTEVLHRLQNLYEKRHYFSEAITLLQLEIKGLQTVSLHIPLYYRIADLALKGLHEVSLGVQAYQQILNIAPLERKALEALQEIYEQTGEGEALRETYEQELKFCTSDEERVKIYQKLGILLRDRLDQPQLAIQSFQHARTLAPDSRLILKALKALYEQTEDFEKFFKILESEILLAKSPEEQLILWEEKGKKALAKGFLERVEESYQQILSLKPQALDALNVLKEVYRNQEKWDSLLEILRQEYEGSTEEKQVLSLLEQRASVLEDKLGRREEALIYYEQVYDRDPYRLSVAQALKKIYREEQQWKALVSLLHRESSVLSEKLALSQVYQEMAELYQGPCLDLVQAQIFLKKKV